MRLVRTLRGRLLAIALVWCGLFLFATGFSLQTMMRNYWQEAEADGLRLQLYDLLSRLEVAKTGLPGRDGLSVLKEWRSKGMDTPVLVLTARGQLHEKIEGLNAGADDYLTKPFQVAELVARVQALVRRAAGNASSILEIGGVRLDMAASQVWYEGTPIKLTAHEFRVLGYLMQHRGKVVSRSELIDHIYAQDFDRDSNTVEVFIGRIRKKTHADLIETVRGLGYRINE